MPTLPPLGAEVPQNLLPPIGGEVRPPDFSTTNQKDASGAATVDPNTVGTLIRHLWSGLNPVQAGQALPFPKALGGSGMDNPLLPSNIASAMHGVKQEGDAAWEKGDKVTAATKYVESIIPLIGPWMSERGNQLVQGKYAAVAGDAGAFTALAALPAVASAFRGSALAQTMADSADMAANRRVTSVIAPNVGPNKLRFGNMAADVAPTIARETTGLTSSGVGRSVAEKFNAASDALDSTADNRLNARTFSVQPVVNALKAKLDLLKAKAVEGSQYPPPQSSGVTQAPGEGQMVGPQAPQAVPLGQDVLPAPNTARAAPIQQALSELQQLGPVARYEALRRIRQAWDAPARGVYNSAVTPDFMAKMGEKLGAADVTGTLREHLASFSPEDAAANADYSLWKKASDVLTATEETERVRPTVGRSIMARGLGAAAGAAEGGGVGAIIGGVVGPMVERGLSNLAPAAKMLAARQLAALADGLRSGNVTQASSALRTLKQVALPASTVVNAPSAPPIAAPMAAQSQ